MDAPVIPIGARVRIINYSPYRGLAGTVQKIETIRHENDHYEFYQIDLEGVQVNDPLWFEKEELSTQHS